MNSSSTGNISLLTSHLSFLISSSLRLCVAAVIFGVAVSAQTAAPGGPGKDAQWATAAKQGVGTSATTQSKVWFTLAQGVMTEVYYPDVTVANVHLLQFIVVNPKTKKVETEQDDAIHQIRVTRPDSLTFQQINTAKSGEWKITKTYITDVERDTVLIKVQFESEDRDLELHLYYDPSLANSGMHDSAWTKDDALLAQDEKIASALVVDPAIWGEGKSFGLNDKIGRTTYHTSNGFYGISDGLTELRTRDETFYRTYFKAENGNVVQVAPIRRTVKAEQVDDLNVGFVQKKTSLTISLSFGTTVEDALKKARTSLEKGFSKSLTEYEKGWADYVKSLPQVDAKYQAQFNMAAMQLKAHEDKANPGANIASMSVPWGGGKNANDANIGGYHLVWSRDLYQVFTAFMAIGDKAAAERALDFLFKVQQKPDGSFPQNSWLDGRPFWGSLQMDEVAYPLIMAYQLGRFDKATWENHVKKAADFIIKNGPSTPQERWEEEAGYSPSTIAAQIAGLVCAAEIAKRNGDEASAIIYLAAADDWARNVERWTATTTGKYGDGNYYLRITQKGNPDAGDKIELNNGAGFFDERDIVDAGFLELVRLGIKPADDPLIMKSLKVIDQVIKVDTPNGPAFYRYNNDGYGEMEDGRRWNWDGKYTGKGRLWALLSGERGQYEIAKCETRNLETAKESPAKPQRGKEEKNCLDPARDRLDHMLGFANDGLMIPEQVWDKKETPRNIDKQFIPELKFGEGTGSATPLAWSMAQFIRLATNLKAGRNLDTPDVVYERYKNGIPAPTSGFGVTDAEAVLPMKTGEAVKFPRQGAPGTRLAYRIANGESRIATTDEKGQATMDFVVPEDGAVGFVGVMAPDGSTAFERVTLRTKPKEQDFSAELIAKISAADRSPARHDGKAVIFYRGQAESVQLAGDLTDWTPGRIFLQKVAADLWAAQLDLEPAARVEYKLIVDGKWMLDPANPDTIDNGVGDRNNFFAMQGYTAIVPVGKPPVLEEFDIESRTFGTRRIKVYVPKADGAGPMPVLYLQDGSQYANRADAALVLESLIARGKVKPFILVFIDPKDRGKEYWANDQWADFVATELVPEIDRRYKTIASRDGRATLGASLGGITSLWIGIKHPDKFGRLGGQSSSFWVDNGRVVKALEKLDPANHTFRFYLDDGVFEGVDDSRRVNVMLRGKGYAVAYKEGQAGHNWTSWRDRLADAFVGLMN